MSIRWVLPSRPSNRTYVLNAWAGSCNVTPVGNTEDTATASVQLAMSMNTRFPPEFKLRIEALNFATEVGNNRPSTTAHPALGAVIRPTRVNTRIVYQKYFNID